MLSISFIITHASPFARPFLLICMPACLSAHCLHHCVCVCNLQQICIVIRNMHPHTWFVWYFAHHILYALCVHHTRGREREQNMIDGSHHKYLIWLPFSLLVFLTMLHSIRVLHLAIWRVFNKKNAAAEATTTNRFESQPNSTTRSFFTQNG